MKDIHIGNIRNPLDQRVTSQVLSIYCGRPGALGNPYILGRDGTRDQVCDQFEEYLNTRTDDHPLIRELQGIVSTDQRLR